MTGGPRLVPFFACRKCEGGTYIECDTCPECGGEMTKMNVIVQPPDPLYQWDKGQAEREAEHRIVENGAEAIRSAAGGQPNVIVPAEGETRLDPSEARERGYYVNEMFYSIQGEGMNAGLPMIFVRFGGCNLRCNKEEHGFDCDTEFVSGRHLSLAELVGQVTELAGDRDPNRGTAWWVLLTGGEPALQVDAPLLDALHELGFTIAIETNGTKELPRKECLDKHPIGRECYPFGWITVSPKSAEHTLRQRFADEVKYVRRSGQGVPKPTISAPNLIVSPACEADGTFERGSVEECVRIVKENPQWRLSVQVHKVLRIR